MATSAIGPARKTVEGYETAAAMWFKYSSSIPALNCTLYALKVEDCTKDMFDSFAVYCYDAKYMKNGVLVHYATGTIMDYVSGVFNICESQFPGCAIFQENLKDGIPKWYSKFRKHLGTKLSLRVFENGEHLCKKAREMGRPLTEQLAMAMLKQDTKEGVENSSSVVANSKSGGRYLICCLHYMVSVNNKVNVCNLQDCRGSACQLQNSELV